MFRFVFVFYLRQLEAERAAASPSGHNPRASYVMSSLAEKQSCSSTTFTSLGFSPAASKHFWAAALVISYPTWKQIRKYAQKLILEEKSWTTRPFTCFIFLFLHLPRAHATVPDVLCFIQGFFQRRQTIVEVNQLNSPNMLFHLLLLFMFH